ncbi:MAG: ABC transporter permease subunit [Lachnospiraceae bacterium]|nr:ABC transporter permease subunit [Lachnospiraceae bacterium]MBP5184573.1 ABC transporter permease subunit [Lachnospiraceae bacterium]
MIKRTVIGLNLKYYTGAFIGAVAGLIALFLPYASKDGKVMFLPGILLKSGPLGLNLIMWSAFVFTVLSAVSAVVQLLKTSVAGMKIWQVFQAVATVSWTLLLFSSKKIFESAGLYTEFLNKNLSFGFFIGIIAAYWTLVSVMRCTRTNRGYILLVILGVIWLFPILWIVLTSLRAEQGYYVGYFFPHGLTLDNFKNLFSNPGVLPFGKWWVNTFLVAICGCVFNTMIVLMTAFILSRTRFRGRKAFMNILMIIGMFPGFMSLIAVYNILKGIGLNQSLLALIIVGVAGAAMGYHVTKGFFDTIPRALDEAAIIDGASRFQIFSRITLPLSKSIIVYIALGGFLGVWSDYIFPSMLFGDKQSSYTVAVGLFWMTDFKRIDTYYTQFAAGAVLVAIPIVILFVWLQRFYVEGLSGSVKG